MKKRLVLFITIVSILATGCSSKNKNKLVEQGKDALENHNYKEAKEFLSQALDDDSTDEHARAMYVQAARLEKAIKYEEQGNYKKAIEELDIGEKIKNGSQSIHVDISNKKKELTKLNEEYLKSQETRKENAKIEVGKVGEKIKNGSQSIHVDISNKKKELTKLNEEYLKSQETRKENAKIEVGKDRYRVEQLANKENQKILEEKRKEEEAKKQEEYEKLDENKVDNDSQDGKNPVDIIVSPPTKENEPKI